MKLDWGVSGGVRDDREKRHVHLLCTVIVLARLDFFAAITIAQWHREVYL